MIEDRSPDLPQNFEFLLDAFAAVGKRLPVALGVHPDEGGGEWEGQLDEPVQQVNIAEEVGVIQIGVEITLNQGCYIIIEAEVRVGGQVLGQLPRLHGVGASKLVLTAEQVHLNFVLHFYYYYYKFGPPELLYRLLLLAMAAQLGAVPSQEWLAVLS